MKYKQIVWDWNGTLLDDVDACIKTMNTTLARRNMKSIENREHYRSIFGFPVIEYYKKLGFDFKNETFLSLADEYVELYDANEGLARLYDGVFEVIETLRKMGIRQTLISATKRERLLPQLERFGVTSLFDEILGIDDHLAGGKDALVRRWSESAAVKPDATLFVGDTTHDLEVARTVGADCVLLSCGHESRERLARSGAPLLDSIKDIVLFAAVNDKRMIFN